MRYRPLEISLRTKINAAYIPAFCMQLGALGRIAVYGTVKRAETAREQIGCVYRATIRCVYRATQAAPRHSLSRDSQAGQRIEDRPIHHKDAYDTKIHKGRCRLLAPIVPFVVNFASLRHWAVRWAG